MELCDSPTQYSLDSTQNFRITAGTQDEGECVVVVEGAGAHKKRRVSAADPRPRRMSGRAGKLKYLPEMPMDILFEVSCQFYLVKIHLRTTVIRYSDTSIRSMSCTLLAPQRRCAKSLCLDLQDSSGRKLCRISMVSRIVPLICLSPNTQTWCLIHIAMCVFHIFFSSHPP
jgi:hypothetical protein